jgi:orotidine-5'-phosphate decarboxylase
LRGPPRPKPVAAADLDHATPEARRIREMGVAHAQRKIAVDATAPQAQDEAPQQRDLAMPRKDALILALDVPSALEGEALAERLGDSVSFYKIGLGMLTTGGLALANELKTRGKRIFLDMKLFDIPATVEKAARGLAAFELDLLTVHGDPYVVEAAVKGRGDAPTRILAVTVMTSLDRADLDAAMIVPGAPADIVLERARRAFAAGADGVIASAHEAAALRALPEAAGKLIVTPGVRPAGAGADDQKRVVTPAEAIRAGADHMVIGRPIWAAADPKAAAEAIQTEIAAA